MKISCLILCCFVTIMANAEVHSFSVYSFENKHIGGFTVQDTHKDTIRSVQIEGEFFIKKVFSRNHYSYSWSTVYRSGRLYSSDILIYKNANVQSTCRTVRKGNIYSFTRFGAAKKVESIGFTESELYFREPKGVTSLYSEQDGAQKKVEKKNESLYEVQGPSDSGQTFEYRYKDGVLWSAKIFHKLIPIMLRRDVN